MTHTHTQKLLLFEFDSLNTELWTVLVVSEIVAAPSVWLWNHTRYWESDGKNIEVRHLA